MRKKNIKREVAEEIDKLTNSIENTITGDIHQTDFYRITKEDLNQIKVHEWLFDWHKEVKSDLYEVYKLTIRGNPNIIQGLLSFKIGENFISLNLVESAKFNRGQNKMYIGVLGNMFAYVCKRSKDEGFGGFVAFVAKTALKEHYARELGAKFITGNRMFIDNYNAEILISKYFKK